MEICKPGFTNLDRGSPSRRERGSAGSGLDLERGSIIALSMHCSCGTVAGIERIIVSTA